MEKSNESFNDELTFIKGEEIIVITKAVQLNLVGQVFRPIFAGKVHDVQESYITLSPVIIKMVNAPFYEFPLPITIPLEKIVSFSTEVPNDLVFPLI